MANSQINSREIIVGTGLTSPSETTLTTFKNTATAGEIGVFAKDGSALAAGDDFVVAVKLEDSNIIVSDVIKSDTVKATAKATAPETQKQVEFSNITVPSVTGASTEYLLDLKIYGHAGSTSVLDYYTKFGHYVFTQNGSGTGETVVDGLIENLNKSFSKEANATSTTNPLFTFTKGFGTYTASVDTASDSSGNITVSVNDTDFVIALAGGSDASADATAIAAGLDGETVDDTTISATASSSDVTITLDSGASIDEISFTDTGSTNAVVTFSETASTAALIITAKEQSLQLEPFRNGSPLEFDTILKTETGYTSTKTVTKIASPGVGTGKEVAQMEFFYRGARGDSFRGVGFPYSWPTTTKKLSDQSTAYDIIEIRHRVESDSNAFNVIKMPKSLVIACPNNATNDVADTIIDRIEVATGLTIAGLS